MLIVRKDTPPRQHGGKMSENERRVARELEQAFRQASERMDATKAWGGGNGGWADELEKTSGWKSFRAWLGETASEAAMKQAGVTKDATLVGAFDILGGNALAWSGQHSAQLIKYLDTQATKNVNKLVQRSLRGQLTSAQLERRLRQVVTLTPAQARSVETATEQAFRDMIKAGKSDAYAREATEKMAARLWEQKLRQRTRTISLTELSNAANAGHMINTAGAIQTGWMSPETVKEWNTAEDERTCEICRPLNGQKVRWDQPFDNGLMMPPAHISCRCSFSDIPPDAELDSLYKPTRSEQDLYGNTVTPAHLPAGYVPPDLSELSNIFDPAKGGGNALSTVTPAAADARAIRQRERAALHAARRMVWMDRISERKEKINEMIHETIHENRLQIYQHLSDAFDGNWGENNEWELEVDGFALSFDETGIHFAYKLSDQRIREGQAVLEGKLKINPKGEVEAEGAAGEPEMVVLRELAHKREEAEKADKEYEEAVAALEEEQQKQQGKGAE